MLSRLVRIAAVVLILALLVPGAAMAQSGNLSDFLSSFLSNGIFLDNCPTCHAGHFTTTGVPPGLVQLNNAVGTQFTTSTVGSSSGGFTYTFDPALGVETRVSDSFGSPFAERALTLGKGQFSVGATFQHYSFDSFEGIDLDNGEIVFDLNHTDVGPVGSLDPFFEGDIIESRLFLDLTLDTSLIYFNWGAMEKLDVGVVLPFLRAEMDAGFQNTILPISSGSGIHQFPGGELRETMQGNQSATGIGDMSLRIKYNFMREESFGMAVSGDVRLPTGDEQDLLGTGTTQVKVGLIGSGHVGNFWPHFNLGYAASLGDSDLFGDLPDEITYVAGFDVAVIPRLTFAVDLLGRTLLDAPKVELGQTMHVFNTSQTDTAGITGLPNLEAPVPGTLMRDTLISSTGTVSTLQAAVGLKANVAKTVLIGAGLILGVTENAGLRDNISFAASLEYSF